MTLRTPRRRISPRTKRRYRAIREFFRRALGSSSQPDIKIGSSIALNVTDLKRKIIGLEQQLDEVNKHCQDITGLDCSRRNSESYIRAEVNHEIDTIKEQTEGSSEKNLNGTPTKVIFKSAGCAYGKSKESDYLPKTHDVSYENQVQDMNDEYEGHVSKVNNKKSKLHKITDYGAKLHKYRARSVYDNLASVYSTSSFHSLNNPRRNHHSNRDYTGHLSDGKYLKPDHTEPLPSHPHKERKHKEHVKRNKMDYYNEVYEQKPNKIRKQKHHKRELDQDFIADIIRRQYKPVTMFGRKESDLSQISAPVCRDQDFPLGQDIIQEGHELCSCCYDDKKHKERRSNLSDMRSICDTRLYSSKKHARSKHRRKNLEFFNNSDLYDLIPVKEKSSPKTRRKFSKENMIPCEYYREVPPSPRTLRPRLNLKAQYNTDFEDYMAQVKYSRRKGSPYRQRRHREHIEPESDMTSEVVPNLILAQPRKTHAQMRCQVEKQEPCPQDTATFTTIQYPPYINEQATIDTTFNKTQETEVNVDKTDKALCEIKDILQNFLHEIKKETTASQCDKSEVTSKTGDNGINVIHENSAKLHGNVLPSRQSFNNYGVGQCNAPPFMPSFTNPCCYPVMPMCPMNCPIPMQNSFMMPSPSFTCANCAHAAKEPAHTEHCCSKNINTAATGNTETCHTDTEELIKEIYKFVAQGPVRKKEYANSSDRREAKRADGKILTSRSVGESSKFSRHDAKVGTPPLKCYSKSCEAIGSRINTDPYSSVTNASYSDTILEKLSLEVTQTTSETEADTETTDEKTRPNKFSKVLRSMGLFKKKKKDVIEELSESESTIDVEIKPKSPYRQDITSYVMHGQEYYRPPPVPPNYQRPNEYQQDYHPPYNPGVAEYPPSQPIHDIYSPRAHHSRMRDPPTAPPYNPKHRPTAPPYHSTYENPYKQMQQPQVPLCLKEIEVKSIGTQSERKMSIFRKIQKKIQPPIPPGGDYDYNPRNCSTQTQTQPARVKPPVKPLFNWKGLQAKAMQDADKMKFSLKAQKLDPLKYSLKAQQELAAGDQKLRNAMLKKLFYKRNPFSPRNLIVRTLLGKDKSSFGEAPHMYKPRMFF